MNRYNLQNNQISIFVNSFGAELCSVKSKQTDIEYIWQADKSIWARHAPNLFPIVGRLKDGEYTYNNKTYQLPQHGFARDNEFTLSKQTESELVFELNSNSVTFEKYPFNFKLEICYTLHNNNLTTTYTISNQDKSELFFSVGAHPAFNCPLQKDEQFEDYELIFEGKQKLIINTLSDGLISSKTKQLELIGNSLPVTTDLFDNDALVFMNAQIQEVSLISKITKHGIKLSCNNWPYFGIWTKKQTEKFICLEPWFGIADMESSTKKFSSKTGIMQLEAKQQFKCTFECTFF